MEIRQAIENAGSEIFTLTQYLGDKEMETLHGQRFRKMIETLKTLIDIAKTQSHSAQVRRVELLQKELAEKEERILELYHHELENHTLRKLKKRVDSAEMPKKKEIISSMSFQGKKDNMWFINGNEVSKQEYFNQWENEGRRLAENINYNQAIDDCKLYLAKRREK